MRSIIEIAVTAGLVALPFSVYPLAVFLWATR
jgi:hypothetical protein